MPTFDKPQSAQTMNILLENVEQEHVSVLRELAKALHINMRELDSPDVELNRRIETIVRQADAIPS
jgi:hypothetical protein